MNRELLRIDQTSEIAKLLAIWSHIEEVSTDTFSRFYLLQIHDGDHTSPIMQCLQTACRCLPTNTVQHSINPFRMSSTHSSHCIGLCIIDQLAGTKLGQIGMIARTGDSDDVRSQTSGQLNGNASRPARSRCDEDCL